MPHKKVDQRDKMRDPTKTTKETKDENRQTKSRVQNMSIWPKKKQAQ